LIPIFDTVLVTIMRPLAGKAISQGWNDHTSHRLVALGLSERKAVLLLYALAAASGMASLLVRNLTFDVGLAILATFVIGLALLGIQLADVKIFSEAELEAARKRPLVALLIALSFKRRIFEMALDVVLFVLSYYLACALMYGTGETNPAWGSFRQVVAILVTVRLTVFLWMGVYRGIWKYVSFEDAVRYAQAVALGSVLTAFVVLIVHPIDVSGVLFVLDGLLTFVFVAGSRVTFLVCGRMLPQPTSGHAKRVLIYGAGEAGLLSLRLLQSDPERTYEVVGFLDDDRLKEGMRIRGLPVYHPDHTLAGRIRERSVEILVISSEKIADEQVYAILDLCPERDLAAVRLRVDLQVVRRKPMMAAG
jgi:UDP-GlcNAc:undecaprenyl-phosphate GlcNAc-1-phosphate transferase